MTHLFGFDAFSPAEIAARVETMGVSKARLPLTVMAMLGILAGAFIGLGALGFVLVQSDSALGFAGSRLLGGVVFSMGLILVVIAGAELFTGNNLLVMAWAGGKISTPALLRNWLVVSVSNFIGAAGLAALVFLSGHAQMNNGVVAETYLAIAISKCIMPFWTAFFKGLLCNALVCLAVWMAMAGHTVTDKVLAIVFPVSAFVAAGFEHSIANMYLIPMAMMLKFSGVAIANSDAIGWMAMLHNLGAVILGNIVGGSGFVGLIYYLVYLRKPG